MLLGYIISCLYILTLGSYWIYTFASNTTLFHQDQLEPGTIISLVSLSTLIVLILSSILYFCYLRYFLKLTHKQIVSQTMNKCHKGWWIFIGLDLVLGIVIYYFTIVENMDDKQDFIKLHLLFIIMILFVASWNGLRWFRLKRAWEIVLFVVFLGATAAMYFVDFYFHQYQHRLQTEYKSAKAAPGGMKNNPSSPAAAGAPAQQSPCPPFRPQFQHYISGPLIITYQYLYISLSLSDKHLAQKIICKLIQYFSIGIFTKRVYYFIQRAKTETYFSFDFIWAMIICVMVLAIIVKDVFCLVKFAVQRARMKDREKYIQEFRGKVISYLEERSEEKGKVGEGRRKESLECSEVNLSDKVVEDCIVCLGGMVEGKVTRLDCRHQFHYGCIFEWFNRETVCPICRRKFQVAPEEEIRERQGGGEAEIRENTI